MVYRSIKPILVEAVQAKEASDVPTSEGILHLEAGDWLLRDPQGNLVRCKDIDFKCTYEVLNTSLSIEVLHEGKSWGC